MKNTARLIPVLLLSVLGFFGTGCKEGEPDVFERRYALVTIPGLEIQDHVELLDHTDANIRYLALGNLLAMRALDAPNQEEEEGETGAALNGKVRELLDDPAAKVRAVAAYAPRNRAGADWEPGLLAKLDDSSDVVRVEVLASVAEDNEGVLSAGGTGRVMELLDDDNILVRLQALVALGSSTGDERAGAVASRILQWMREDGRERLEKLKALDVLKSLDTDEATEGLLTELRESEDEKAVQIAAMSLADSDSTALEAELLAALEAGRATEEVLMGILAGIATRRSLAAATSRLEHESSEIRTSARNIIAAAGDQSSLDALLELFRESRLGAEKSFESVATSEDSAVRELEVILKTIRELGERLGVIDLKPGSLGRLLASSAPDERLIAMSRLREEEVFDGALFEIDAIPPAQFVDMLTAMTAEDSPLIRATAFETLGHSVNPAAAEALLRGMDDPLIGVRAVALMAIIRYASTNGDTSSLRKVYQRREEFAPSTFAEDDPALIVRLNLEGAVTEVESSWASTERAHRDLRRSKNAATRLLAAAMLASRDNAAAKVLIEFLASGTDGEKHYALQSIEKSTAKKHADRLREIATAEENEERKTSILELITD